MAPDEEERDSGLGDGTEPGDRPAPDRAGGEGDRDPSGNSEGHQRPAADVPDAAGEGLSFPRQSPLFHAEHSDRYARQELIREYEKQFDCRLIVMVGPIFAPAVTLVEELIYDADPAQPLHLLLDSPGGDGETAVRLARQLHSRCSQLTVIVPNQAKSAGTILLLGAHEILMGPTSDLGPVDPQFVQPDGQGLVAAKDIIAAVENAEQAIADNPDTYALYAACSPTSLR